MSTEYNKYLNWIEGDWLNSLGGSTEEDYEASGLIRAWETSSEEAPEERELPTQYFSS